MISVNNGVKNKKYKVKHIGIS
ncbi:MAG: ferrous iron transporter A, partial [Staphylococcus sp.]|nr:ferrous iron transporter A [Staphylococcus sp.]